MPDPLHPAMVHFPIALAMLMPALALLASVAIARHWLEPRAWAGIVLLQAILLASGVVAMETGEDQEERVEHVTGHHLIHEHAEAAETLVWLAGGGLLLSAGGLLPDEKGRYARWATAALSLAVLGAAAQVGHLGGELVYRHGAASAYTDSGAAVTGRASVGRAGFPEDDDDD